MILIRIVGLIWIVVLFTLGVAFMRFGYPSGELRGELSPIGRILDKAFVILFIGGALFLLLLERLS